MSFQEADVHHAPKVVLAVNAEKDTSKILIYEL